MSAQNLEWNLALLSLSPSLKYVDFDDIAIGNYAILEFSLVETECGKKIKVQTAEFYSYLPEDDSTISRDKAEIELVNRIPCYMAVEGKDHQGRNRVDLYFD